MPEYDQISDKEGDDVIKVEEKGKNVQQQDYKISIQAVSSNNIVPMQESAINYMIYNILKKYIDSANKSAGWNYDWDWTEMLQFTKYNVGQFYDWHPDQHHYVYPEDDTNVNMRGKYRKLSTTLLLNDSNEFKGGELEFHFNMKETKIAEELTSKGTLVVFPAFVYHRVREVTEGTRYSLVSWSIGAPFR